VDIQVARRVGGGCADRGCVPELGFAIASGCTFRCARCVSVDRLAFRRPDPDV
jgi:hypothetical protein